MVDVRGPAGVGSIDERTTSSHCAAATGTDVRVAARALESMGVQPAAAHRRFSAQVAIGGGLLVVVLIVLAVSVVFVSNDSKHPLVQVNPSPPTTTAAPTPSPTVAAGPIPLPATTTPQAPAAVNPAPPVDAMSPSRLTAETMTPAPPPTPRHPRLHDLFPHLFPSG
jgi:hypothetical protein